MKYTITDKTKAIAIVSVFETGRAFGDYAAVAVLNDGAGISYGICQFTHRSGSLARVLDKYLASGSRVGRAVLETRQGELARKTPAAIKRLASDDTFKRALRAAGVSREMKQVQMDVAFELYLNPAIEICERREFSTPLALAVVYDSVTHGSFERIAARAGDSADERGWITRYVQLRHAWLSRSARLKATTYRTKFFLGEIKRGNWALDLPLDVHGVTIARLPEIRSDDPPANAYIPKTAQETISSVTDKFDRVESTVTAITSRKDAAKSLWTTVGGTIWQTLWAVISYLAGIPREVWIVVAIVVAALLLFYLYRQIEMGRIREQKLKAP